MITLTFWACSLGAFCSPPSNAQAWELPHGTTMAQCDEYNALTDLTVLDMLLASGRAPRHTCAKEESL